jgi:hypothetical protein
MFENILELLIALVEGRNLDIQDMMLNYFETIPKSEFIFK